MKKILAVAIGVLLAGAAMPLVSVIARGAAPIATVDPFLAAQLRDSVPRVSLMVTAADHATAASAASAAGLRVGPAIERANTVVATGTRAQVLDLQADPRVARLTGNRPIRLHTQSSHRATRGEDAMRGFVGYRLEQQPPIPGKKTTTCRNVKQRKNGRTRTVRRCTTKTSPPTPRPPIERAIDVAGTDGTGVSIAVVDSGVDGTHPMFMADGVSRVVRNLRLTCATAVYDLDVACDAGAEQPGDEREGEFVDFASTTNNTDVMAWGGHGTHVASTAAGGSATTADGRRLHGAAPGSKIVALSMGANDRIIGAVLALEWVLENHHAPCGPAVAADVCPPIKVVNNSWGSNPGPNDRDDPTTIVSNELVKSGVVVVFSHGNDGGDGTKSMANPEAQNPTPGVIAVASADDQGTGSRDAEPSAFSSRGKIGEGWTYPDVSAPGTEILAACRPYLNPVYGCNSLDVNDPNYGTISGTSMAAPHVSGIVAQLFQAAKREGITLLPAEVERILETTAYKFGGGYETDEAGRAKSSFDRGHGLIDAKHALAALAGLYVKDATPPVPTPVCAVGQIATDAEGDGTTSSTDVLSASMEWNPGAREVTFVTRVSDLTDNFALTYNAESFYVDFAVGGRPYFVSASRSLSGEDYGFGRPEETEASSVRSGLSSAGMRGSFDVDANTVTVVLTQAALDEANEETLNAEGNPVPALADGLAFTEISVATYLAREVAGVGALTEGDVAAGGCSYGLGAGASGPPPPPSRSAAPETPPPPPSASETPAAPGTQGGAMLSDGQSFTAEGAPSEPQVAYSCTGPGDPVCFTYAIDVRPSDGTGTLGVGVYAFELSDYDVTVYDANLNEIAAGVGLPATVFEEVDVEVTAGRYYVVVQPYTALPETPFTLEVSLA